MTHVQMSFQETYRSEVLQSRRHRSRRAHFWARFFGLILLLTVGATLRSEPELRRALAGAGMDAVMAVAGRVVPGPQAPQGAKVEQISNLPTSRIKVNRFKADTANPDQAIDPQALAQDVGRTLAAQKRVD